VFSTHDPLAFSFIPIPVEKQVSGDGRQPAPIILTRLADSPTAKTPDDDRIDRPPGNFGLKHKKSPGLRPVIFWFSNSTMPRQWHPNGNDAKPTNTE
jgi:hypothetical protein